MHPTEFVGKLVNVQTSHAEIRGILQGVEDWGTAGGGNYLIFAEANDQGKAPDTPTKAVAMRAIEFFEPIE